MTMDIKMLREIADSAMIAATHANEMYCQAAAMAEGLKMMAEAMKAVVDDCAKQILERRAAGISEKDAFGEAFAGIKPNSEGSSKAETSAQPQNGTSGAFQHADPTAGAPQAGSRPAASEMAKSNVCSLETAATADQPETQPEEKLDLVTLRAFVAKRTSPETRTRIKDIIRKYGADRLTDLDPSTYASVKREVAEL